jgi:uncharacterized membrane protein
MRGKQKQQGELGSRKRFIRIQFVDKQNTITHTINTTRTNGKTERNTNTDTPIQRYQHQHNDEQTVVHVELSLGNWNSELYLPPLLMISLTIFSLRLGFIGFNSRNLQFGFSSAAFVVIVVLICCFCSFTVAVFVCVFVRVCFRVW